MTKKYHHGSVFFCSGSKYQLYALLLSYILLLQRFGLKSQEQLASPQNLKATRRTTKREGLGRNLVPWQEGVGGTIPPVGIRGERPETEIRRGPPAPFLSERERETAWGETNEWEWGSWNSPWPLLTPTRPRQCGSTACHRGSTA